MFMLCVVAALFAVTFLATATDFVGISGFIFGIPAVILGSLAGAIIHGGRGLRLARNVSLTGWQRLIAASSAPLLTVGVFVCADRLLYIGASAGHWLDRI